MKLIIHLLGKPRLLLDGQPIKFCAPPKTFPLLAYLLLHRDRPIDRQQIAFELWPDAPEPEARANLRRHLHHLRHALPPPPGGRPWLLLEAATVQWNPQADIWLDVAQMEQLAAQPETLAEAVQLYCGDLLETVYDDWVFAKREALRELFFRCLEQLIAQNRLNRDYPAAIGYARQLLGVDPFREDVLRQLMAVQYEAGNRAGAIQEYTAFEHRLRREIGVDPMPETRTLYELILRNARLPGGEAPPAAQGGSPSGVQALPFVGRKAELDRLANRWSRAARGQGGLVLISGEAGIGKSRLAGEVSRLVEAQGGRVLYGATSPHEPRSYQAITEALQSARPLLTVLQKDPACLPALAALVPELAGRQKLAGQAPPNPENDRLRLFDAVANSLVKLAEPRPLLLVLEDLHWAGAATFDLLQFIARRAAGAALLIIGTYRDEETPRTHALNVMRRGLQVEKLVDQIPLGRLPLESFEALMSRLAAGQPGLPARLHAESEGNPLYLQILWHQYQTEGYQAEAPLPGGIQAAIAARLAHLPEDTRAYAEVAAVLGPAFDAEAAREVGGWDEIRAHDALRNLLDRRILHEAGSGQRYDYRFTHHLIQAVLYDEMSPARRKRRHRRAAEVIADLYPAQHEELAGELAYHYDAGGAPDQAIACYHTAAKRHLAVFADNEALRCIDRAIQLCDEVATPVAPRMRANLLLLRAEIHYRHGDREEEFSDLQQLVSLSGCSDDLSLSCEVLKRQILYYRAVDDKPQQQALLQSLNRQAARLNDPRWLAEAAYQEAVFFHMSDEFSQAIARFQQALDLYTQLQDTQGQVVSCCGLSEVATSLRQNSEAEHWAQRALELCRDDTPSYDLLRTLWNLAANEWMAREFDRCLAYAQKLMKAACDSGNRMWQAQAYRLFGLVYRRQFKIAQARSNLETAYSLYQSLQKQRGCAMVLEIMGHLDLSLGHYQAAIQNYQQALRINQQTNSRQSITEDLINIAFTAGLQQDYATDKQYAGQALELAREIQSRYLEAHALQNLSEAERGLGDLAASLQHLLEALRLLDPSEVDERTSIAADLALTYLALGDLSQALCYAEEVIENYPQVAGRDDNNHRYIWVAARVLRATGQDERARQVLAEAYQAIQEGLAAIPDAESRRAFESIYHNQEIAAAYQCDEWP